MQLLIQSCKKNDRESQRLLYQHYYGYAMSICVRYCRSYEESKEVVNDGFMKVFKKLDQHETESSFKAWLRRIMINSAIDHYRKEVKHYHQSMNGHEVLGGAVINPALDELSYAELIGMVQRLSPAYRAVFNLHVIDGFTHEEIGGILGISEGTSKSNLMKARENLKKMLEKVHKGDLYSDMSDNELDNLFKEAADGFKAPNDPSAWQAMSGKLDQAAVATSFWNWKTISSLTVVGVTGIALVVYLSVSGSFETKMAASDVTLNQVIKKELTETKPPVADNEVTVPLNNTKDKNELVVEESNQNRSKATESESNSKSEQSLNSKGNNDQAEVSGVQTKASQKNIPSSELLKQELNQTGKSTSLDGNSNKEAGSGSKAGSGNNTEQAALITEVAVTEKSLDSNNSNGLVAEEQTSKQTLNDKGAGVQSHSIVAADSLEKFSEEKQVTEAMKEVSETKKPEEKDISEPMNRFAVKLAFAPDYTTVKSATPNSLGINYGVLFEYKFSKHWSIATGGIWSKKIYSAYNVEYSGYSADWVDGDCRMWDIPINVYYNFASTKPFSFYASVGLSSYLMKEENYVYYVETPYGTYDYPQQVNGKNNEWFKTLNVSMGMQYRMSQRFSIQFEPTLKAPLAGVGEGEVSLVSLGAFLNLRFDIPVNKTSRDEK